MLPKQFLLKILRMGIGIGGQDTVKAWQNDKCWTLISSPSWKNHIPPFQSLVFSARVRKRVHTVYMRNIHANESDQETSYGYWMTSGDSILIAIWLIRHLAFWHYDTSKCEIDYAEVQSVPDWNEPCYLKAARRRLNTSEVLPSLNLLVKAIIVFPSCLIWKCEKCNPLTDKNLSPSRNRSINGSLQRKIARIREKP